MRKFGSPSTDNPDRDDRAPESEPRSPRFERFVVARAGEAEFAVPASAIAAVDIASEERWADLGAGARGVLWEGRYLFVETIPGERRVDVRGRGEFPFIVLRASRGLAALVIDRLLGELVAVREPAEPPWAGRVRAEGREYPVLAVAAAGDRVSAAATEPARETGAEPGPASAPALAKQAEAAEPTAETPVAGTESPAASPPAPAEARDERRRRRAAVVDPRIGWRRALARRLRERGLEVREASRAGEFRGAAGIAFIGDVQTGARPEAAAEMLRAAGWRVVLVAARRPASAGPFEAVLAWPVRDEDLDNVLAMMGGVEDAGREGRSHPGGGKGST